MNESADFPATELIGKFSLKNIYLPVISFLVGLFAGFVGGLVGLGGGVVMIPLMVGIMKLTQHRAHGTSLVALVFTGIAGAAAYFLKGSSVDAGAALLLSTTALFTARKGAQYAHSLPEWKLKRSFGGFLIFIALLMLSKPYLPGLVLSSSAGYRSVVLLLTGILTGFFSGMMGVGGGTVMVAAMVLFAGMGQHISQGTSLLVMVPAGTAGAYTHWRLGNVEEGILYGLVPGVIIGAYSGGTLAQSLPEGILRIVFASVLIWTGSTYLRSRANSAES